MPISKKEWEAVKKFYGNKCRICGETEKSVGKLMQCHIKPKSKGGTQVFPLCPNCHNKYDEGLLTMAQLKKLHLTRKEYEDLIRKTKTPQKPRSPYDHWPEI